MAIVKVNEAHQYTTAGGASTQNLTIPSTTAGNTLVAMFADALGTTLTSITCGGVNFTKRYGDAAAVAGDVEMWTLPNVAAGQTTVTFNFSGATNQTAQNVTEWSGMPTTLTIDQSNTISSTAVANVAASPSITPTTTGYCVVFAVISSYYSNSNPSGYTALINDAGTPQDGGAGACAWAYKILSAGALTSTSWTATGSYLYKSFIIALDGATSAFNLSASDSLTLTDSSSEAASASLSASDSLSISDSDSRVMSAALSATDTLVVSDSVTEIDPAPRVVAQVGMGWMTAIIGTFVPPSNNIALRQQNPVGYLGTATLTYPFGFSVPTAAGNTAFLFIAHIPGYGILSIDGGGFWNIVAIYADDDGNDVEIWFCSNIAGGTQFPVVTFSAPATDWAATMCEFSGMPALFVADASNGPTMDMGAGNQNPTGSITPTAPGQVLVVVSVSSFQISSTPLTNGYTMFTKSRPEVNGGVGACAFAYKILSSGAATSTSFTTNGNFFFTWYIAGFDGIP